MEAPGAPGAVWVTLVAAGVALLVWAFRRARTGPSPFGPQPSGELPDTRTPLLLAVVLWLLAPVVAGTLLRPEPGAVQPGVLLTLKSMEFVVALVLLRAALGSRRPAAGRVRLAALAVGGGLATFALTAIATWLVIRGYVAAGAKVPSQDVANSMSAATGEGLAALVLSAVVAAPFAEEVLYRGLLFPALAGVMPVRVALVAQAALFGFVHFWSDPGKWALALPLAVVGYCAGWLYHRSGSLWAAVGLHAVYNAIQVGFILG